MQKPLISIIIPTYDRAHLILDTLDSIIDQSYTRWECLVIDDGSTDDTETLLNTYSIKDPRITFHKRPQERPKGANACRNYGFEMSTGDYINWFDSDDVMMPNKLEKQVESLLEHEQTPYCICQTEWVNKLDGTSLGLRAKNISSINSFEDYICFKIFWSILAPLWRRTFLIEHNLQFNESLHQSQEYDFHIKALAIDSNYIAMDDVLVTMYQHEENLSNSILTNTNKVRSNSEVKLSVLKEYQDRLSSDTQIKLLEMLTLMYKDLLCLKQFKSARHLKNVLHEARSYVPLSYLKEISFYLRIHLIYYSYRFFGRGYSLLKPISA